MPRAFASGILIDEQLHAGLARHAVAKLVHRPNFHVVSTCSNGNGGGEGWNALRARCSMTAESLPIEYSITGFSASATTSRMMWIDSASRRCRWVSDTSPRVI